MKKQSSQSPKRSSSPHRSPHSPPRYSPSQTIVEVVSDIEGCWTKLVSFMTNSDIFTINGVKITFENFLPSNFMHIEMKPNTSFVYLGDTVDNGYQNLAILSFFKHIRDKFHKKENRIVTYILGNRDFNLIMHKINIDNSKEHPITENFLDKVSVELSQMGRIFDKKQFLRMYDEGGLIFNYLRYGKIVYYDKTTKSLFVHGGIDCDNLFMSVSEFDEAGNIVKWVDLVNNYYINALKNVYETNFSRKALGIYFKQINTYPTIVQARPWNLSKTGIGIGTDTTKCSDKFANIRYVFSGHTPIGQIPIFMKMGNVTFVFCDTSRAGRAANVKLIKSGHNYGILIKAKFDMDNIEPPDTLCDTIENIKRLTSIKYSSFDNHLGTIHKGLLVISKIGEFYILARWREIKKNGKTSLILPEYKLVH